MSLRLAFPGELRAYFTKDTRFVVVLDAELLLQWRGVVVIEDRREVPMFKLVWSTQQREV